MKKYLFAILGLMMFSHLGLTQNNSGTITFNRKMDYFQINSSLPWMTQAEIDRNKLTWGRRGNNEGQDYAYNFKNGRSTYKKIEKEDGGRWHEEVFIIQRDYDREESHDIVQNFGKDYIIKDAYPEFKWKILNEIRDIAGYICMKAETVDPLTGAKVEAWFTDAIPVDGGPEGFHGLPGMILYLVKGNNGVIVEATNINLEKPLEKVEFEKKKGKDITREDYTELITKFISNEFKSKDNPYWRLRY